MDTGRTAAQLERERRVRGGWQPSGPRALGPQGDPSLLPGSDETLDRLSGDWCIFQLARGHRYSTDDLLAAWYGCRCCAAPSPASILDLGCGIGSVGLLAAWRFPQARLVGVEAQEISLQLARRSVRYNGLAGRARHVLGDLRDPRLLADEAPFDLVLGSPPYLPPGSGVESQRPQCGPCRFEERGGVEGYCEAAARHLSPGGVFALVYTDRDRGRVRRAACRVGLQPRAEQPVITRWGDPPLLRLFAFGSPQPGREQTTATGPAALLEPALTVRERTGRRSEAMCAVRVAMGFPPGRPVPAPQPDPAPRRAEIQGD